MMKSIVSIFLLVSLLAVEVMAQDVQPPKLDRVLMNLGDKRGPHAIAADRGSAGLWERLLKLSTIGSVMHTTAHPDDEHAGLLTYLGRGKGYRTSMLTLNRGEGGANAIGAELFDALGMIRTEELRQSARYYGLDDQYFTSLTDYGYSKTLDEAIKNWGRDQILQDMVHVIRLNRPLVVVSRFHGSPRDGHGHHQAIGGITHEAVEAAGDPDRFVEDLFYHQLRPWKPLKVYRGGVRPNEPYNVTVDPGAYAQRLGDSYQNFGYFGLSLQKSQTSGRYRQSAGATPYYYERQDAVAGEETDLFDGIDTSLSGMFALFGETHDSSVLERLMLLEEQVAQAIALFTMDAPHRVVPALVEGLQLTRELLEQISPQHESHFLLRVKAVQFEDAIHAALGMQVNALALPSNAFVSTSPWAPLPTMGAVIPGKTYKVAVSALNPSPVPVTITSVDLAAQSSLVAAPVEAAGTMLVDNEPFMVETSVQASIDAAFSRTYFSRDNIYQNRYQMPTTTERFTPRGQPAQEIVLQYEISGVALSLRAPVYTRTANLPDGYTLDVLKIAPRVAVNAAPATRIVPLNVQPAVFDVEIEVINNDPDGVRGALQLSVPEGWRVEPATHAVAIRHAGQQMQFAFRVTADELATEVYPVRATMTADGVAYSEGYELVDQPGLEKHYLFGKAQVDVHGLDVDIAQGLHIGYVMGVGDAVPDAIEQLGATVTLLAADMLETGDLNSFDAIVIGTRAYAVRQDLLQFNARLMDYAQQGGHLIVLYQTPEYQPQTMAPFAGRLPRNAEEISEEDAPVEILEPMHPVFNFPNKITAADFDHWVEQRGSKFFTEWDAAYTPLVSSNDTGQAPQQGGWLMAEVEAGHFTYFAYAIQRQAPFGIAGALRIFANVLSYGKETP
ncbi:MAG: PIG-L family deacetylase [Bacteroidota bacterium]